MKTILDTDEQIQEIIKQARKNVYVNCNEYHYHTSECIDGDPKDVVICKLVGALSALSNKIESSYKKLME